jgi:hypothetical protein
MSGVVLQPVDTQKVVGGGRLCFRGDTRPPAQMFSQGFFSRNQTSKIQTRPGAPHFQPIHRLHEKDYQDAGVTVARDTSSRSYAKLGGSGDINPPSAVCVTPRFAMAPLFPIDETVTDLWVYSVYVRELFNTQAHQYAEGMLAIEEEMEAFKAIKARKESPKGGDPAHEQYVETKALWPLYAQELATKTIAAGDVICALKVRRTWASPNPFDPFDGCSYVLDKASLDFNPACTLGDTLINPVKEFLKGEPDSGTTPSRSSGFHKSTKE